MPRASWRGFLRFSLVSCPIYLSPATTLTGALFFLQKAVVRCSQHVVDSHAVLGKRKQTTSK